MSKHIAERFWAYFYGHDEWHVTECPEMVRAWFDAQPELDHTTAIDEALAGALQDVTDEEELDGPMPLRMREAFMADPEKTLRAAVIATKKGIYERIDRRRNAIKERG